MQNNMKIYKPKLQYFLSAYLVLIASLVVWFHPITHHYCAKLDAVAFLSLNGTLLWSTAWQQFWGWLNHPNETWLNLVVMVAINVVGILTIKPRQQQSRAWLMLLYFWGFFQLGLLLLHLLFTDILALQRTSPSIMLEPIVVLSEVSARPCKIFSYNCFPAGHAFVAIYWAGFTNVFINNNQRIIKWLAWCCVVLLILPRLIGGGHWLSDIFFTTMLAYIWLLWGQYLLAIISNWQLTQHLIKLFLTKLTKLTGLTIPQKYC